MRKTTGPRIIIVFNNDLLIKFIRTWPKWFQKFKAVNKWGREDKHAFTKNETKNRAFIRRFQSRQNKFFIRACVREISTLFNKKTQWVPGFLHLCPEQESNLHDLAATGPWNQRVYQFRHLGINCFRFHVSCFKLTLNLELETWNLMCAQDKNRTCTT